MLSGQPVRRAARNGPGTMRPDIDELQEFYASRQGQLARRLVHRQVKALWPDLTGGEMALRLPELSGVPSE